MKLTRWGHAKFPKAQTAYVAVVVPFVRDGKTEYQWVTTLWYGGRKEWRCENHKKALLMDKKQAEDFVSTLAWYGQAAWTVTVFPDCIPENNY
jgi:hypothetical protein